MRLEISYIAKIYKTPIFSALRYLHCCEFMKYYNRKISKGRPILFLVVNFVARSASASCNAPENNEILKKKLPRRCE